MQRNVFATFSSSPESKGHGAPASFSGVQARFEAPTRPLVTSLPYFPAKRVSNPFQPVRTGRLPIVFGLCDSFSSSSSSSTAVDSSQGFAVLTFRPGTVLQPRISTFPQPISKLSNPSRSSSVRSRFVLSKIRETSCCSIFFLFFFTKSVRFLVGRNFPTTTVSSPASSLLKSSNPGRDRTSKAKDEEENREDNREPRVNQDEEKEPMDRVARKGFSEITGPVLTTLLFSLFSSRSSSRDARSGINNLTPCRTDKPARLNANRKRKKMQKAEGTSSSVCLQDATEESKRERREKMGREEIHRVDIVDQLEFLTFLRSHIVSDASPFLSLPHPLPVRLQAARNSITRDTPRRQIDGLCRTSADPPGINELANDANPLISRPSLFLFRLATTFLANQRPRIRATPRDR